MTDIKDLLISETKPLTLKQLKTIYDEPVWVKVLDHDMFKDPDDDFDGWGMVRQSWVRLWDAKRADLISVKYDFKDYGKTWIAYSYKTLVEDLLKKIKKEKLRARLNAIYGKNNIPERTNIMNENIKIFLNVLHEYGYLYLARDPEDHSLYAYKFKPHLEDGCYETEQIFSCFPITPRSVETFINDHDIEKLYEADPEEISRIPVQAIDKPVLIETLM